MTPSGANFDKLIRKLEGRPFKMQKKLANSSCTPGLLHFWVHAKSVTVRVVNHKKSEKIVQVQLFKNTAHLDLWQVLGH